MSATQALLDPDALLGASMARGWGNTAIHWPDGSAAVLPVARWLGEATAEELAVLDRARGPVLDVGCGPGRHVAELHRRGAVALGIDVLPEAVRHARARGATALRRSVFGDVPGAGTWRTALLLDGNVGIGGDPVALLRRLRALLRAGGTVLLEVEPDGVGLRSVAGRLETPAGRSTRFGWGRVGRDGLRDLADAAGFAVEDDWRAGERWFAELAAPA